ncbi:MAG: hypothetical protein ACLQAH_12650 [Limisphaerales bacterium]
MKMNRKRWLVRTAVLLAIVAGVILVLPWAVRQRQYLARKAWKEQAIPEIAKLSNDSKWVSEEIALLGSGRMTGSERIIADQWLTDRMILMASGEWLVYKSHCSEAPPHQVLDIFLAKGSNGKWYYSTCHFCVGMCALVMMQDMPSYDLATFARQYHLKEFDGVSDECLQQTQTFPDTGQTPARTYTADSQPGLPDLSPVLRAAAAVVSVATNADPDLKGHCLDLYAVRYEHRFLPSDRPAGIAYMAIYCDSTLRGGNATGIDIEVRDNVADLKSQKGQLLWSCPLDGKPRVPEDVLVQVARGTLASFWPKIDSNRLSLDEIVCCDPMGGNKYSVSFRLAAPFIGKSSTATYTPIEVDVSTNGTVAESEVRWTSK